MRVEYETAKGERGLKVSMVRILDAPAQPRVRPQADPASSAAKSEDDGMCDVLSPREFVAEVTDLLIQHVPTLTGAQIALVRQHLVELAQSHGWVEA
jgi:CspA family cold shock protein